MIKVTFQHQKVLGIDQKLTVLQSSQISLVFQEPLQPISITVILTREQAKALLRTGQHLPIHKKLRL